MQQQPPPSGDGSGVPPMPASPPTPAPGEAHRRSPVMVWGVVAAAVSAAAGVASAVAAFTGSSSQTAPSPTTSVVAPPPAPTAGATAAATTPKPTPAAPAAATVRWTGKIVLGMEGIDLTQVPPTQVEGQFLRPGAARTGGSGMTVKGTTAVWTDSAAPTAEGCRNLLQTQQQTVVDVVAGDQVCVVNETSPIGLLKVTKTYYMRGSYGELDAELTIWDLRLKG
ncbi:hypothetical protein [Kitasatospora sp. NPDC002040]|uniref:hypothetical protein n=1 Tax=Kitasatospora sp. NPDC002040 TaxID=3154661 RepID=UPI003329A850